MLGRQDEVSPTIECSRHRAVREWRPHVMLMPSPALNGNSCQFRHAKRRHTMATGVFGSTRRAAPSEFYCCTTLRDVLGQSLLTKDTGPSARQRTDAESALLIRRLAPLLLAYQD